jgi:hypothetical protein
MSTDILGKGLAFPLQGSPSGGNATSQQAQKIRESILVILGTQHGERLMRPTFGCNLRSLVFAPNTRATAELARFYVEEGLATWEPRILVEAVSVANSLGDSCLVIAISYRIKSTNEPQNMVYPFYLEQR